MRAIVVSRTGGPEVLEFTEHPDPRPGPGQVLIDVAAAGVNFIDVYHRTGAYPKPKPYVPGTEAAGTVLAVGADVTEFAIGDRVASSDVRGGYAERTLADADRLVPVPDGVETADAAAVMLQGMTAHYLTHSTYPVQAGDTVLVHAAAGGMGLLLTRLATLRGARVIGTASTPEKAELARGNGCAHVLEYDGFADRVRELTGGAGVAAVFDGVGAATFDGSLAALRPRGVLALYGYASGPIPPFDINRLALGGSLVLTRPTLGHYIATRDELRRRASDVLGLLRAGELRLHIGRRYDLADAGAAHDDLEHRRTTGKLLLLP